MATEVSMPFKSKPENERGVQRQIRFSPDLLARIEAAARDDGARGWSTWVRVVVEKELDRRDRRAKR